MQFGLSRGVALTLAELVLAGHLSWILFVILGALWTRNRPTLAAFHLASLFWGIAVELGPWPCPLTLAEQFFETEAGTDPYRGSFLIHYLDAVVYPTAPEWLLTACGLTVIAVNLAIYAARWRRSRKLRAARHPRSC